VLPGTGSSLLLGGPEAGRYIMAAGIETRKPLPPRCRQLMIHPQRGIILPVLVHAFGKEPNMSAALDGLAKYIPLLIPVILLELGLMVFALMDLSKRPSVRGPKWVWILVIVLVDLIGPVVYFLYGRERE
jgi:hypothetical protein